MASAFAIFSETLAASRRRDGLRPLSNAEMSAAFRRPLGASAAERARASQADSNSMWDGIVQRLNASLPGERPKASAAGLEPVQQQADVNWGSIASQLNAEAGLATPASRRACR
jgi:hypothetical protein